MAKIKLDKNKILNFKKEAIYKIVVDGILSESYSNRLTGMQITVTRKEGNKPITTLIGAMKDQSALSGILSGLHDMQFTVISVNMLSDVDDK